MVKGFTTFSLVVTYLLMVGCSTGLIKPADPVYGQAMEWGGIAADGKEQLSIQYLGVGGHLFRYRGEALMTAPSFSNPSLPAVGPFVPLSPNTDQIDRFIPRVNDVEIMLVGHAHYDHLLDVPYVMNAHAPQSHLYGSTTSIHSIAAEVDKARLHSMNAIMAKDAQAGEWVYSKKRGIRFMAIRSSHAPHLLGLKFMKGFYSQDLESLPWHAHGWKEGQTLAFLIDFMGESGKIDHRVYYQDAASSPNEGRLPTLSASDSKAIDIAILCSAAFHQEEGYPESTMNDTKAQHFIIGHWEDFFGNDLSKPSRWIRLTSQKKFFERFENALPEGASWALPDLFATQYF